LLYAALLLLLLLLLLLSYSRAAGISYSSRSKRGAAMLLACGAAVQYLITFKIAVGLTSII